jgi:RNA polymerase sigma-70 factor (ECF subfamily)
MLAIKSMHHSHVPCGDRARVVPLRPWPGILSCANETDSAVNDERSVLASVAQGNKDAFAGLYDRHVSLVYGIAKRITGNPAQAEDITQSVFTMLWAKPDSFGGGNFAAWIARVARNASLDVVRSAAVRTREPEMPTDIASESDLEDEVFSRLESSAVVQALRALPDDQREAIEQAYFQGLSYSEVAARLGAPLGTVKSRIRTGLRRLWETLQRQVLA